MQLRAVPDEPEWIRFPNNQESWDIVKSLIRAGARMATWDGEQWQEVLGSNWTRRKVAAAGFNPIAFIGDEITHVTGADPVVLAVRLNPPLP